MITTHADKTRRSARQQARLPRLARRGRARPRANPHPGTNYVARFTAPEFTSLCPVTGQPDFAHLVIDYVPGDWLVESKSLKLYLGSFRNHGAFHEDCTVGDRQAARRRCSSRSWLRIGGYWYPRGGIPIDVFWQTGRAAEGRVAARSGRRALSRAGLIRPELLADNAQPRGHRDNRSEHRPRLPRTLNTSRRSASRDARSAPRSAVR